MNERKKAIRKEIISYGILIAVSIILAFLISSFVLYNGRVPSGSMENTIMTGDRIFGFRLAYLFSEPERGDIIIFRFPDDESQIYVKRIIGIPGDTVEIIDGVVYIDTTVTVDGITRTERITLEEDYIKEPMIAKDYGPYTVPADSYFCMGDNRNLSDDSRRWKNTYVTKDQIIAKAFLRYWPSIDFID